MPQCVICSQFSFVLLISMQTIYLFSFPMKFNDGKKKMMCRNLFQRIFPFFTKNICFNSNYKTNDLYSFWSLHIEVKRNVAGQRP